MKRFRQFLTEQDQGLPVAGEPAEGVNDDVELVQIVLDALRVRLGDTQRHYFAGEPFHDLGALEKLRVVEKIIEQNRPVNEQEEGEEDPLAGDAEGEEGGEEGAPDLPLEDEVEPEPEAPLEIEDVAETASKALLKDPTGLRHSLTKIPHKATEENHREAYKFVQSRLFY